MQISFSLEKLEQFLIENNIASKKGKEGKGRKGKGTKLLYTPNIIIQKTDVSL